MDIKELDQESNDLEERLSKLETCIRALRKRRQISYKAMNRFRKEASSQSCLQEEIIDENCSH